jgi:hypothetical protein
MSAAIFYSRNSYTNKYLEKKRNDGVVRKKYTFIDMIFNCLLEMINMRSLLGKIVMFLVNTSRHVISLSLSLFSKLLIQSHYNNNYKKKII